MKISIITINYNNKQGLIQTIQSIKAQTYADYEVVLVDGASRDGSLDVIKDYAEQEKRLVYVSEKDKGIYNAMNKGTLMSRGEYCIFMNSGDCFYDEQSLKDAAAYLDGTDIISGVAVADKYTMIPVKPENLSMAFFLKNSMNHQSCFIKTSLMKEYLYDERYRIVGDTEFFFRAMIMGNCTYRDIPVKVCYCEDAGASGNLSASMQERYAAIKALVPARMSNDVDFIVKYHNPVMLCIGNLIYNRCLRWLYDKVIRRGRRI